MAEDLNVAEICQLLREKGFQDDVVEVFRMNKIDGSVLVELDADDMKELGVKALGDRKKLNHLIKAVKSGEAAQSTLKSRNNTLPYRHSLSPPVPQLSPLSSPTLSPLSSQLLSQTPPRPSLQKTPPPRRNILDNVNGALRFHQQPKLKAVCLLYYLKSFMQAIHYAEVSSLAFSLQACVNRNDPVIQLGW